MRVPIKRKVRLHFHEFMREVHRELVALQGTVNPWMCWAPAFPSATSSFASTSFTSLTSPDAMILHRLLVSLFDNGVGL